MTTLTITRGLPGSGKTTWARAEVYRDPENVARVNRDDIRMMLYGKTVLPPELEPMVTKTQHHAAGALLKAGKSVIVDDTNLHLSRTVRPWQRVAYEVGAAFHHVDFDVTQQVCLDRLHKRARERGGAYVPDDVVTRMHNRYLKKGFPKITPLQVPACEPYVPDPQRLRKRAYIFDMDGTLTMGPHGRSPYEWHKVGQDQPNPAVIATLQQLQPRSAILIVSGRDGSCRSETLRWLQMHSVYCDALFMREAGDMRRDDIVKAEIFDREIRPFYNVLGVFDDRNQVVRFWRSIGLTTFQVAEGAF